jgi:phage/plasmid-like protein (TIGR03299 family)
MAHQIEQFTNGQSAFFTAREPAWHKLGTVTPGALSAQEALDTALLAGWNVRTEPLVAISTEAESLLPVPDRRLVIRNNPVSGTVDPLGVVGTTYRPIQNEEAFRFLDNLVDASGAHFETAGSLLGGRQVFVSLKLPEGLQVGGQDRVDLYLLVSNTHDGTGSFRCDLTPVRVVCANTLRVGLHNAARSWKVRHTNGATSRIDEARRTLDLGFAYRDEWAAQMDKLVCEQLSTADFGGFVEKLLPVDDDATTRTRNRVQDQRNAITALYHHAPTNDGVRGTKWGALNAVAEYADWAHPVRGGDDHDVVRARRVVNSENTVQGGLKDRAYDLLAVSS